MRYFGATGILASLISSSLLSASVDFSQADALFFKRSEGFAKATEARESYSQLAQTAGISDEDKIYAVSQMARLDMYRGAMIPGVDLAVRREVFKGCINTTNTIRGDSEQFYYYFFACNGFLGKISPVEERLKIAESIFPLVPLATKKTSDATGKYVGGFEGGGILRVLSGVYGSPRSKPIKQLYNPQEAQKMASAAINTPEAVYRPYTTAYSGENYVENAFYLQQARATLAVEAKSQADLAKVKVDLQSKIEEVEGLEAAEALGERAPETMFYKREMQELIQKIDESQKQTEKPWYRYLLEKM